MGTSRNHPSRVREQFLLWLVLLLHHAVAATSTQPQTQAAVDRRKSSRSNAVSAIFAFGDSTVDPGNNNYLLTPFKSNFPPYGRDFYGHEPTGRFTNGKLATDFIASYLGLKDEVPAYLDPSLGADDLITGVSFASAGAGFDPVTAEITVTIPIQEQIIFFEEYVHKLQAIVGKKRSEDIVSRAIFIISGGTNDFIANYLPLPVRRQSFSIEEYQKFLIGNIQKFLQALRNLGAQRIAVAGLPPIGCLPIVITLYSSNGILKRDCIEAYNIVAKGYNKNLQIMLGNMSKFLNEGTVVYFDAYKPLLDQISAPEKYGFVESKRGCCGTGLVETSILCNPNFPVCPDASKFIFWDSVHPTEKSYYTAFMYLRPAIDRFVQSFKLSRPVTK